MAYQKTWGWKFKSWLIKHLIFIEICNIFFLLIIILTWIQLLNLWISPLHRCLNWMGTEGGVNWWTIDTQSLDNGGPECGINGRSGTQWLISPWLMSPLHEPTLYHELETNFVSRISRNFICLYETSDHEDILRLFLLSTG